MRAVANIGRLFTATGDVLEDAAVAIDGDRIAWVGRSADVPAEVGEVIDAGGALVTPGLVDAHTHPVYAGDRSDEIARRSAGAGYEEISAAGGGIAATVAATRAADPRELQAGVEQRLRRWLRAGTTTVEAKTGYHLNRDGELGAVGLLDRARAAPGTPRVVISFLGAHAVPPEFAGDPDGYAAEVASWCWAAASAGAGFGDVFCDAGYFNVDQSRIVLEACRNAGLDLRIHAEELALSGGALLAAELGAASADHLLRAGPGEIAALAGANVVATLAPLTALAMGALPPAKDLVAAGVPLALGTDHNPGTSGSTDMTVVVAAAVAAFGISVTGALTAATSGGARSLRRDDIGVIAPGAVADIVVWDADHEGAFAWAWGVRPRHVLLAGEEQPDV